MVSGFTMPPAIGVSASAEDTMREAARASWRPDEFLDRTPTRNESWRTKTGNPEANMS
jgi:hypothetical protein